jgi:hypothetical protein
MAKRGFFSRTIALPLLLGAGVNGCYLDGTRPRREVVVETTTPPAPSLSTLVVRWTISGTRNPDEYAKANATEIEASVSQAGREIGAWRQRCETFALRITLHPGDYEGSAFLLAANGRIRTTTVQMDPFTLRGNDTLGSTSPRRRFTSSNAATTNGSRKPSTEAATLPTRRLLPTTATIVVNPANGDVFVAGATTTRRRRPKRPRRRSRPF